MPRRSALKNSARAVRHVVERRRHPQRFIQTDKTPWDEIYRDGIMAVRHYSLPPMERIPVGGDSVPVARGKHRRPLILVPALGIHCWTFDLMPDRSMVRYLMARGHDVYVIDWGRPSLANRDLDLDTYVNQWMPAAVQAVAEHGDADSVNLLGYCMGGLLCLMYLGGHPDAPVRSLATIASPVNFHESGLFGKLFGLAAGPLTRLGNGLRLRLKPRGNTLFHIPAGLLSLGFKMTNPPGVVQSYMGLLRHLDDRDYLTEYMTMGQWFNDMVDYPGAVVREVIEKMVIGNSLARGRVTIGERRVDFGNVTQDLLAFAGSGDRIVTVRAAREVLKVVASAQKRFEVAPGGHAGVFAGSRAPQSCWRVIADWLVPRAD